MTPESKEVQIFSNPNFGNIRVFNINNNPWFAATDVCKALEISNPSQALTRLDDDEKMTITLNDSHSGQRGGAQSLNIINESGLYSLVLSSRKPEAKQFKRWITHEVIPSIRKTGSYSVSKTPTQMFLLAAQAMADQERRLLTVENQQVQLNDKLSDITKKVTQNESAGYFQDQLLDLTDRRQQQQLNQHEDSIKELQAVISDKGPAEELKTLIANIVNTTKDKSDPWDHPRAYNFFYSELRRVHHINIASRITNLKRKRTEQGWSKSKVNLISGIDAIESDPMIWDAIRNVIKIVQNYLDEAFSAEVQ